jgi:signal transduction histidine kinase
VHTVQLIQLIACVIAAMGAAAIASNDTGRRVSRIIAIILACSAWWSLCEVIWNAQTDEEVVLMWIRASSLGWLWLGPLALDCFSEVDGDPRFWLRRIVPVAYTAAAVAIVVYVATPWGVTDAFPTSWGWAYRFGPAFPFLYGVTVVCIGLVVASWPRVFARATEGERRQARYLLIGLLVPLSLASFTDVVLPLLGIYVPRLGSVSLLAVGFAVAWSVRRHGYLLLTPDAFAKDIVESLQDGVALLRADGQIVSCNVGLAALAGVETSTLRDRPIQDLLPGLPMPPTTDLEDRLLQLESALGDPIPVSVSSTVIRGGDGKAVGQVLAVHDLREVMALRNRLVTTGRLATAGELAAGIAHEIANPIAFIRSNLLQLQRHWEMLTDAAEKLRLELGPGTLVLEGSELIEESIEGVDRVSSIVRDVGAFSRGGRGGTELADVNLLLDNTIDLAVLSFSVVIERFFADLPLIRCDPNQLKQVFLNLLMNALQAVGDFGNIRVITQQRGAWVTIRVEDDGPGVPDSDIDRIFDPFFTTRPAGEGIGMGLAQCYRIIRDHSGSIHVESKDGEGTRFEVRLPIELDADEAAAPTG